MSIDVNERPELGTASLVTGILSDIQRLVEQQFELTRREIEEEFRKRLAAAAILGGGIGGCFLGLIGFCLTVVHLLHWLTSPVGSDPATLPLWACHGAVALFLEVVGGILIYVGQARFMAVKSFHNPITELLQEPAR